VACLNYNSEKSQKTIENSMPIPSYYFTLFKKFQVLNHVPTATVHGSGAPTGGFDLKNPNAVFGSSNRGALLGATTTPADSPLWAVLNSRAAGNAGFFLVTVGANTWPTMPPGVPPAWNDFQLSAPAPKVVDVFSTWITAGKVNDVPNGVIGTMPAPIGGALAAGVNLFVCSMPGDNGTNPVPSNFWDTSLIFLVDPMTGNTVTPPELSSSEYYLAGVIGNRGAAGGGRYLTSPIIEAAAWVMVWNTGMSPAVQLPSLSNLDLNSTNGVYDVYFLRSGQYDVVGFRLNVQSVFDGLVAALTASGMNLGGLTPEQWIHAQGAHLCAKVLVRNENESWPAVADTPFTNRRIAQKNLVPFPINLAVSDPDPNIIWTNFVVGDVFSFMRHGGFDERWGRHTLTINTQLPVDALRFYLAVPKRSFARWFQKTSIKGFRPVAERSLRGLKPPFPEHVILALAGKENSIEIPALGHEFLAMSLGIEYSVKRLKTGMQGPISVIQQTAVPKVDVKRQCYEIEKVVVGGFTLNLDVHDSRKVPAYGDVKNKKAKGRRNHGA
jgi:hypothetical protein